MTEANARPSQANASDISTLSTSSPPTTVSDPNPSSQPNGQESETPSNRSHDPTTNLKRTDPFGFGSRYLQETDNVFEFNAWDHVLPDASYYDYAETQYTTQRAAPVSDFDKKRFNDQPEKWWNKFYSNNTSNFFKDRKWLHQEFPILSELTRADAEPAVVLEVGAGAGNTAFPILKANENPGLMVHACDFSRKAVELMRANEAYDPAHICASVWDISGENLPDGVEEGSVDVVLLVFIFSALSPRQWDMAVKNVWRALKPDGEVCFRDYGKGDLTQVRFKKGRLMEENFYIRGDGTRVYFFEENELRRIWGGGKPSIKTAEDDTGVETRLRVGLEGGQGGDVKDGSASGYTTDHSAHQEHMTEGPPRQRSVHVFEIVSLGVDRRMLVNRQKQLKMYRCWMQGRFKKPRNPTTS